MVRSQFIYIAYDNQDQLIVAGTVKKEVLWYLQSHPEYACKEIRRFLDGRGNGYSLLELENET